MRGKDGDAPFDGGKDRPPRIAGEVQTPDRGEKKGMVGQQRLASALRGLRHRLGERVQGDAQPADLPIRIADHQPDVVPIGG